MDKDEQTTIIGVCQILEIIANRLEGNLNEDIINDIISILDGLRVLLMLDGRLIPIDAKTHHPETNKTIVQSADGKMGDCASE